MWAYFRTTQKIMQINLWLYLRIIWHLQRHLNLNLLFPPNKLALQLPLFLVDSKPILLFFRLRISWNHAQLSFLPPTLKLPGHQSASLFMLHESCGPFPPPLIAPPLFWAFCLDHVSHLSSLFSTPAPHQPVLSQLLISFYQSGPMERMGISC